MRSTCRQLQLHTSNHSPINSGTIVMGCVRGSNAHANSGRPAEVTHEVFFVNSQLRARRTRILAKSPNVPVHAGEPIAVPWPGLPTENQKLVYSVGVLFDSGNRNGTLGRVFGLQKASSKPGLARSLSSPRPLHQCHRHKVDTCSPTA